MARGDGAGASKKVHDATVSERLANLLRSREDWSLPADTVSLVADIERVGLPWMRERADLEVMVRELRRDGDLHTLQKLAEALRRLGDDPSPGTQAKRRQCRDLAALLVVDIDSRGPSL